MKGLGGTHGMNKHALRSYVFFKALSFIMTVIRDICSGVALWLGITVVGSPVGAVFATIAFYTGAAKLAIDIMLLVQASIARAKTNDPLSRILLANQQSTMAGEVGAGAGAMGAAGLMMGLSGSTGLLQGGIQQSAFGTDVKLGQAAQFANSTGLDTKIMGIEAVRKVADQVTLGPTIGGALPGVIASDDSHKSNTLQYSQESDKKRSAIKAVKNIFHPFDSGIKRLHRFANKAKIAKAKEMANLGTEISQQVKVLQTKVNNVAQDDNQPQDGN